MAAAPPEATESNLKRSALGWLGRREYSRHGMQQKIYQRFKDAEPKLVEDVLLWLEELNYLNDERFGGMLLRYRVGRGQGIMRVRQALQQEKLDNHLIEQLIEEADIDWFEHAFESHQRRFEHKPITDPKEKARQLRYLQYRGFTAEQCYAAIEQHEQQYREQD